MRFWPQSLFGRTAVTLALTLTVFLFVSTTAAYYFIVVPMMKRSADDFAAELVSAANVLGELPESQRAARASLRSGLRFR